MPDNDDRLVRSPIERMPYDIMHRIFTLCYTDLISNHKVHHDTPLSVSLILSHVNQHWRSVALSNPLLWSAIRISGLLRNDEEGFKLLHRTETCLTRSRNYPLFIRVRIAHSFQDQDSIPALHKSIELLINHSSRWHSLSIQAPQCTHLMLARAKDHFDSLTNIDIFAFNISQCITTQGHPVPKPDKTKWYNEICVTYENAPSLTSIYNLSTLIPQNPWERLKLWSGSPDIVALNALYRRAHNLTTLRLPGFVVSREQLQSLHIPSTVTILPNLTSPSLGLEESSYGLFMNHVPPSSLKLRQFSLYVLWPGQTFVLDPVLNYLSSLANTITTFTLTGNLPTFQAHQILSSLPQSNITHLEIQLDGIYSDQVDIFTKLLEKPSHPLQQSIHPAGANEQKHPVPFPRLHCLRVTQFSGIQEPTFLQFLKSRCWNSGTQFQDNSTSSLYAVDINYFKGIELQNSKPAWEKVIIDLKLLQDQGLVMRIAKAFTTPEWESKSAFLMQPLEWSRNMDNFSRKPWLWSVPT